MAYVDDTEEQNQQNAQSPQDSFDIKQNVSQSTSPSDSADVSSGNASGYEQSFGGGGSSASSTPKTGGSSNSAGLGTATPGGGFVNFQSYESANPSTSGQISSAGQRVAGDEGASFDDFFSNTHPNSGFSTDPSGAPGFSLSDSLSGTQTGALIPNLPTDTQNVESELTKDPTMVGGWMNETYKPPPIDYSQTTEYQTAAPELSQTGILGGQNNPSVVDYLAQPNIAAGSYTPGERALDQSIVQGDPLAQSAIAKNAALFGAQNTNESTDLGGLATQEATDAAAAPNIASGTTGIVNSLQSGITSSAAANAANANNSILPATTAADKTALDNFNAWYNGPNGPASGGIWNSTSTPQGQAVAGNYLTPSQISELNNIAVAQGQPEPYPSGASGAVAQAPGTVTASPTNAIPAAQGLTDASMDPSDANATAVSQASSAGGMGGVSAPPPIYQKYLYINPNYQGTGSNPTNVPNHFESWMTPAEAAVEVVMNPSVAGDYPAPTPAALQQAASQLQGLIAMTNKDGASNPNGVNKSDLSSYQQELNAVLGKLEALSPSNTYNYGISLGLTPQQLQSMGYYPNNSNPVTRGS